MATEAREKITVLGVGRLGLCLALVAEHAGYDVLGVDVVPGYIDSLNQKTFVSPEPSVTDYLRASTHFRATTSLQEGLNHSDVLFVMVATPTGLGEKSYDHSMLSALLYKINELKVQNKHIIIGCTVLPGYSRDTARFLIRDCENTTLSYNPEFIAQGDIIKGLEAPDMVLIGEGSTEIGDILERFYVKHTQNSPAIHRMSVDSAEICKLSINCFITTKIAFANMIADISAKTPGANAEDILAAAGADSRIGNKYLKPGYGFGGPCFPRDNRALGNYARLIGVTPIIPDATDSSNIYHAQVMAQQFAAQNLETYVFEDVAYKPKCPVPIIEESQKLAVAKILAKEGKRVVIKDRVDIIRLVQMEYGALFDYEIDA